MLSAIHFRRGARPPVSVRAMLEQMARLLKLDMTQLKQHDPRAPLDEIKRMTEQDPNYAFAFRTPVDRNLTAEQLLDLARRGKPGPKDGSKK